MSKKSFQNEKRCHGNNSLAIFHSETTNEVLKKKKKMEYIQSPFFFKAQLDLAFAIASAVRTVTGIEDAFFEI